ncbi:hypothetical protein ACLWBD_12225 [Bdellovibrio sp. HCB117]|uniref:hypothetical protein n=1 Tax=Bdellovibrio sp. HCB117 TaxID=3394359 RepID=UPI0039B668A2
MKTLLLAMTFFSNFVFANPVNPQGEFLRSCYEDDTDFLASVLNIKNSDWTFTHTGYEDESCSKPYIIYEEKFAATIDGVNLDLQATQASYTTLTDTVTEALNMIAYCGFHDWKTGEKKIVTDLICDDYAPPRTGETRFTLLQISEEGAQLSLGKESHGHNGTSVDRRHTELDPNYYIKN